MYHDVFGDNRLNTAKLKCRLVNFAMFDCTSLRSTITMSFTETHIYACTQTHVPFFLVNLGFGFREVCPDFVAGALRSERMKLRVREYRRLDGGLPESHFLS